MSTLGGNAVVGCAGSTLREFDGVTGQLTWEGDFRCRDGATTLFQGIRIYSLDAWLVP